jgi:cytochrome bd-type quinol oxidase subunit 1
MGLPKGTAGTRESSAPLAAVVAALALTGLVIVVLTAPLAALLGESRYALEGALHGVAAGLFMVTATIGLFQAYRLLTGTVLHSAQLEFGSVANAFLAFLTILFGNRIYIFYRASEGPRSFFLEKMPEIHKVFFEFKEFAALFTLPLAVAAAYLFLVYKDQLVLRSKGLRVLAAVLLILTFFYFLVAFILGAAVTKLRTI